MFYGSTANDTRKIFFLSWEKYQQKSPLTTLEKQLVDVIIEHPEYHKLFDANKQCAEPEQILVSDNDNPFLHLGLHLAIRDQIATNRPHGINEIYQRLIAKYNNWHVVEHLIMEPLAECIWQAQRSQTPPDEVWYLKTCEALR